MNTIAAVALVLAGGMVHGSFALPMKRITRWKWENVWLVYSVVSMVLFPALLALATVPSLGQVYARTPAGILGMVAVFGFGWGVGATLFGLGIARVGMALGFSIILGVTSSLGSLLPLIVLNPEELWTRRGAMLLAGLALVVVGIVLCAIAGAMRDKARPDSRGGFAAGLLICLASGVTSPMLNFGFVFGKPIQDLAASFGASPSLAANAIWAPALAAGFLANAGYTIYLLNRNRTWSLYGESGTPPGYWIGGAAMGIIWFGGLSVYGMGAAALGPLGGVVGWPVFIAMVILTANVLGAITREWEGASRRSLVYSWTGIAILILAILIISLGA